MSTTTMEKPTVTVGHGALVTEVPRTQIEGRLADAARRAVEAAFAQPVPTDAAVIADGRTLQEGDQIGRGVRTLEIVEEVGRHG